MFFKFQQTKILYDIISQNKRKILNFLSRSEIIGRNPYGDTSRFFDRAIEDLLIKELRRRGFDGYIVGEELGIQEGSPDEWIYIDPLDGSLNVARGINYYCVSIAYADGESIDDVKSGVVWDIPNDVFYIAEREYGAYRLKGSRVERLTTPKSYDVMLIDVGFTTCERCLVEIAKKGTFRRLGSIIMSCMKVIEGAFEGVFDIGKLKATDVAAASLILREAGAYVYVEPEIIKDNPNVKLIVAKTREIFDMLLEIYKRYSKDSLG